MKINTLIATAEMIDDYNIGEVVSVLLDGKEQPREMLLRVTFVDPDDTDERTPENPEEHPVCRVEWLESK